MLRYLARKSVSFQMALVNFVQFCIFQKKVSNFHRSIGVGNNSPIHAYIQLNGNCNFPQLYKRGL